MGLGFMGLGFMGLGFRGLGFRAWCRAACLQLLFLHFPFILLIRHLDPRSTA